MQPLVTNQSPTLATQVTPLRNTTSSPSLSTEGAGLPLPISRGKRSCFLEIDLSQSERDPLFHFLLGDGWIDSKANPTVKLMDSKALSQVMKNIVPKAKASMRAFFDDPGKLIFRDGREISCQHALMFQYIHACANGAIPYFQLVGGGVRFFFGEEFFIEPIEALGGVISPEMLETLKQECQGYPNDFDFRFQIKRLRGKNFNERANVVQAMTSAATYFLGQTLFLSTPKNLPPQTSDQPTVLLIPPEYMQDVHTSAYRKYSYIDFKKAKDGSHFGIISIDFSDSKERKSTLEALFIDKLARNHLFGVDDLRMSVPMSFAFSKGKGNIVWLNDSGTLWVPILHRALRIVGDDKPETINYKGFLLVVSHITRGFRCLDAHFFNAVFSTFKNHQQWSDNPFLLVDEIYQVLAEHHKEETATILPLAFNLLMNLKKEGLLDGVKIVSSMTAQTAISGGVVHPSIQFLNTLKNDPLAFDSFSALFTLYYHVQEALGVSGKSRVRLKEDYAGASLYVPYEQEKKPRFFVAPYAHQSMLDLFGKNAERGASSLAIDNWLFERAEAGDLFSIPIGSKTVSKISKLAIELAYVDSAFFKAVSCYLQFLTGEEEGLALLKIALDLFAAPVHPLFFKWFNQDGIPILLKEFPGDCPFKELFLSKTGTELIEKVASYLCTLPDKESVELGLELLQRFEIAPTPDIVNSLLKFHFEEGISLLCQKEELTAPEWSLPLISALEKIVKRGFLTQDLSSALRLLTPVKKVMALQKEGSRDSLISLLGFLHGFIPAAMQSGMEDAAFQVALELGREIAAPKTGYTKELIRLFEWALERGDERVFVLWKSGCANAFEGAQQDDALDILEKLVTRLTKEGRLPEAKSLAAEIIPKRKVDSKSCLGVLIKEMMEESLSLGETAKAESLMTCIKAPDGLSVEQLSFKAKLLLSKHRGNLLKQEAFQNIKALSRELNTFSDKPEVAGFANTLLNALLEETLPLKRFSPKASVSISAYFLDGDISRLMFLSEEGCFEVAVQLHELSTSERAHLHDVDKITEAVFPLICKEQIMLSDKARMFISGPVLVKINLMTMREAISTSSFIRLLKENVQKLMIELAAQKTTLETAVQIFIRMKTLNIGETNSKDFVEEFLHPVQAVDFNIYPSQVRTLLQREIHGMVKCGSASALALVEKMVCKAIQEEKKDELLGLIESWKVGKELNPRIRTEKKELFGWIVALVLWNHLDRAEVLFKTLSQECNSAERADWLKAFESKLQESVTADPLFCSGLLIVISTGTLERKERKPFLPIATKAAEALLTSKSEGKRAALCFSVIKAFGLYSRGYGERIISTAVLMEDGRLSELALELYLALRSRQKMHYPFNAHFCLVALKLFLTAGKKATLEQISEFIEDFEQLFQNGTHPEMRGAASDLIALLVRSSKEAARLKKAELLLKACSHFEACAHLPEFSGNSLLSSAEFLCAALIEEGSDALFEKATMLSCKAVGQAGGQESRKNALVHTLIQTLSKRSRADRQIIDNILLSLKSRILTHQPLLTFSSALEPACEKCLFFAEGVSHLIPALLSGNLSQGDSKMALRLIKAIMGSIAKSGNWKALAPLRESPEVRRHFTKEMTQLEAGNLSLYLSNAGSKGIKACDAFSQAFEEVLIFKNSQHPEQLFRELAILWTAILEEGGTEHLFISSMYRFIVSLGKEYYGDKSQYKSPMVVHVAVSDNPAVPLFFMQPPKGLKEDQIDLFTACYEKLLQQVSKRLIEFLKESNNENSKHICLEAFAGVTYSYINVFPNKKRDISKYVYDYLTLIGEIGGDLYLQYMNVANTILEAGTIAATFSESEETLYRLILFVSPTTKIQPLTPRIYYEAVLDVATGLLKMQDSSSSARATSIIHHHFPNLIHHTPKKAKALFCLYVDKVIEAPFFVNDGSYVVKRVIQAAIELFSPGITPIKKTTEESTAILDCHLHLGNALIRRASKPELLIADERPALISCLKFYFDFLKNTFTADDRRKELMAMIKPAAEALLALASKSESNLDLLSAFSTLCEAAFPQKKQHDRKYEERGVQPVAAIIRTFLFGLIDISKSILPEAESFAKKIAGRHRLLESLPGAVRKHAENS